MKTFIDEIINYKHFIKYMFIGHIYRFAIMHLSLLCYLILYGLYSHILNGLPTSS